MKRSELEALGLTKEQVDSVIKINGADIENAKTVAAAESASLQTEVDALKGQVADRDKQIEGLKKSAGDNEDLQKQIETLQAENKAKDEVHAKEITQMKVDSAVEKALTEAGAKNIKAVRALLDLDDAKFDKDGSIKSLKDQVDKLLADESTKFLFEVQGQGGQQKQTFKGFQPGASSEQKPGVEIDTSKMNYDELCAYLEQNPNATFE